MPAKGLSGTERHRHIVDRRTKREEGGAEVQPPASLTHPRAYTFVVVSWESLQFSNLNPLL